MEEFPKTGDTVLLPSRKEKGKYQRGFIADTGSTTMSGSRWVWLYSPKDEKTFQSVRRCHIKKIRQTRMLLIEKTDRFLESGDCEHDFVNHLLGRVMEAKNNR